VQLATAWFGTALLEDGRVVKTAPFPQEPGAIAERLERILLGEVLDEERALAPDGPFEVQEQRLVRLPGARLTATDARLASRASEFGASRTLLHQAAVDLGRRRYRSVAGSPDQHVLMAVDAVDDLAEVANVLSERMREWYGLHYPELDRLERHEEFVALVGEHGNRAGIQQARPELPADSMGADLGPRETEAVRQFARLASRVYSTRADLEKYLADAMPGIAPNLTTLLGPSLAARLVRLAGGLHALARMPSGTIQTLGAEKALFRHLKEGKDPPKHGVLLQHPLVHRAPRRNRGSLARALAGKVALAARADAYTHAEVATKLNLDLERRAKDIERDRARPPRATVRAGRGPPRGAPRDVRGPPREPRGSAPDTRPQRRGPSRGPPRHGGKRR